jgi:predicted RNase H-like HicB family nuclease
MYMKPLFIRAEWDEEASVWVATSEEVPGLATEEKTLEGLIQKLR